MRAQWRVCGRWRVRAAVHDEEKFFSLPVSCCFFFVFNWDDACINIEGLFIIGMLVHVRKKT